MTINRSEMVIINEASGMDHDHITDAYTLDLHTRHLRAAGRADNTINDRAGAIRRLGDHLDPYAENPRTLIEATSVQLAEWQASKAHLAEKTITTYIEHVQGYYEWLVSPMQILPVSPAESLIKPIVKRRKPRPIPEDDMTFALDCCVDGRLRTWMILGGYAGLRSVDIAALNRDDVLTDHALPMLRVRGKGGHEDLIFVGHEVIRALMPYMGKRRGPLFPAADGRRLRPRDIREEINDYLRRLGLPYTMHQFRHRFGTRTYLLSRDLRYTQQQMRHSTAASTELYTLVPTDRAESSVAALDAELAEQRSRRPRRNLSA